MKNKKTDQPINESFVRSYNQALNDRELEINSREEKVKIAEVKSAEMLKVLDEKQALVASKIAEQEDISLKAKKQLEDLDVMKRNIEIRAQEVQALQDELDQKIKVTAEDRKYLSDLINQNEVLKLNLLTREKQLSEKAEQLNQKQREINELNNNISLQKRENEALQKRIQRLITLNQLEQEALQ